MATRSTSKASRARVAAAPRVGAAKISKTIPQRFVTPIVLGLFILWFSAVTITSFVQKSLTVDETIHLLSGYAALSWADFRVNPEHPLLAKILAALPLLAMDVKDPRPASREWDTDDVANSMTLALNDADTLFFYPKLMMVGLALLLGYFVYRWSRELFGTSAAIIALVLYSLDPNVLAHAPIIHTDMPMTAVVFIGTYSFWRVSNDITRANLLFAFLSFAIAVVTKYSYPVLFLAWGLLALARIVSAEPVRVGVGKFPAASSRRQKLAWYSAIFAGGLITAYLCIWAVYGFRFQAIPEPGLSLPAAKLLSENPLLQKIALIAADYHLAPEAWIYGQRYVHSHLLRHTYMLGEISEQGFWLYFPLAFAVKTPLPTLLLFFVALGLGVARKGERRQALFLLVPIVVFFMLAIVSRINIGVRHILPIYPFLFVFISGAAARLWHEGHRVIKGGLVVSGVWLLLSSSLIYPHYLAYFNELIGGAKNGHKVLLDSNLDWGQDLKGLKSWMDARRVEKIQFLYFGTVGVAAPRYYQIDAMFLPGSWVSHYLLPGQDPGVANYVAVSATHLAGPIPSDAGEKFTEDQKNLVTPLHSLKPLTTIGYSILIYEVQEVIEAYRRFVHAGAATPKTRHFLANILNYSGKLDEAVELIRRVVELDPSFALAHYDLALYLTRKGDLDGALKHFQTASALGLGRDTYQFSLGSLFAQQGRLDDAVALFRREIELRPDFAQGYVSLGKVMAAKGDLGAAVEYFRGAVKRDPEFADAHESLARALAEQGKRSEAAEHFRKAIELLKAQAPAR